MMYLFKYYYYFYMRLRLFLVKQHILLEWYFALFVGLVFVDRHFNIKCHNIIFLTVFSHQKKQFYSVLDSLKSLYNDKTHLAQQPITLVHIIVSSLPPYSSPSDCQSSANATQGRFCASFRAYFRHVSL